MKEYFKQIENKLKNEIIFENLEIIDNSKKHQGHKFFSENKFHLKLIIKSLELNSLPRLKAQKRIMDILKDDLKNKIHALEINIE